MEREEAGTLMQQLADGFEALQDEYHKLHLHHEALERKLATARDQYNEVVRLYGSGATTTPPLSLASSSSKRDQANNTRRTVTEILEEATDETTQVAAAKIRQAGEVIPQLRNGLAKSRDQVPHGVKIWSGRSADMPSISESPLEQDFTIEGMPSRLGCPFASMANKKLSSHAASVLSRYNANNSATGTPTSPSLASANRINGKESLDARRSSEQKENFVDPIKAEICGLSDHDVEAVVSEPAVKYDKAQIKGQDPPEHNHQPEPPPTAEIGVCPIRFLDQHSPEEVATYFERHKHELPRSHADCVNRYQNNQQQIQELDAKYGNLVSMISGLGAKHKDMLPEEPEDEEAVDPADAEKIRKWASSVSAMEKDIAPIEGGGEEGEERRPHFERPLREIRVGESPSRPWGITVPAKYVEAACSDTSSRPVEISPKPTPEASKPSKCPFGHSNPVAKPAVQPSGTPHDAPRQPVFLAPGATHNETSAKLAGAEAPERQRGMVLTGPVFIGYSAEDAAKILRESGFGNR